MISANLAAAGLLKTKGILKLRLEVREKKPERGIFCPLILNRLKSIWILVRNPPKKNFSFSWNSWFFKMVFFGKNVDFFVKISKIFISAQTFKSHYSAMNDLQVLNSKQFYWLKGVTQIFTISKDKVGEVNLKTEIKLLSVRPHSLIFCFHWSSYPKTTSKTIEVQCSSLLQHPSNLYAPSMGLGKKLLLLVILGSWPSLSVFFQRLSIFVSFFGNFFTNLVN